MLSKKVGNLFNSVCYRKLNTIGLSKIPVRVDLKDTALSNVSLR